jgi:hypothetical protein
VNEPAASVFAVDHTRCVVTVALAIGCPSVSTTRPRTCRPRESSTSARDSFPATTSTFTDASTKPCAEIRRACDPAGTPSSV